MKLRHLTRYFRDDAVSLWRKLLVVAAGLYVVMPVDAIPDVLPLVGWLDDVGVLAAAATFLLKDVKRHAERSAEPAPAPEPGEPQ